MPKLTVEGFGTFDVEEGRDLLDLCEAHDVPMGSDCGGFAACAACRILCVSDPRGLSPLLDEEEPFLDASGQRLGCQCTVCGDVVVRLEPGLD